MNERSSHSKARKTVLDPDKKFSIPNNNSQCNSDEDWPPARIKYELELLGYSLARVSRDAGYHSSAAGRALRIEWPELQERIAEVLGVEPWVIFQSRYVGQIPKNISRVLARNCGDWNLLKS